MIIIRYQSNIYDCKTQFILSKCASLVGGGGGISIINTDDAGFIGDFRQSRSYSLFFILKFKLSLEIRIVIIIESRAFVHWVSDRYIFGGRFVFPLVCRWPNAKNYLNSVISVENVGFKTLPLVFVPLVYRCFLPPPRFRRGWSELGRGARKRCLAQVKMLSKPSLYCLFYIIFD